MGDARDQGPAQQGLGPAEAEHQPPHQPQPLPRQLQPDHEQQEHHAELGQFRDIAFIGDGHGRKPRKRPGQGAQAIGPQRHAGAQEAQDRADLEPLEQGHDHARGDQEQHDVPVVRGRYPVLHA